MALHASSQGTRILERVAVCLVGLSVFSMVVSARTSMQAAAQVLEQAGQIYEADLATGQSRTVQVAAGEGQLITLTVRNRNIDVEVVLTDPTGRPLAIRTTSTKAYGLEPVTFVATRSGSFTLRVTGVGDGPRQGRMAVTLVERRESSEADQQRTAAEDAFEAGHTPYESGTREGFVQAAAKYEESARLWAAVSDGPWLARARARLGAALLEATTYDKARVALDAAIVYFEGIDNLEGLAEGLTTRCDLHLRMGNAAAGIEDGVRAIALAQRATAPWIEYSAATNVGGGYFLKGDHAGALPFAKRGVALARELGLDRELPELLTNVAVLYYQLDNYGVALQYARQGYELLQTQDGQTSNVAFNARTLGNLNRSLGRFDAAKVYFTKAIEATRATGDLRGESFTLSMIAALAYDMKDFAKAKEHIEAALRARPDAANDPYFVNDLGFVLLKLGDLGGARREFERSEASFEKAKAWDAGPSRGLGLVAMAEKAPREAVTYFRRAVEIAGRAEGRHLEAVMRHDLGLALRDAGSLFEAAAELTTSIDLTEAVRAGVGAERLRTGYLERSQTQYEALVGVLMDMAGTDPGSPYLAEAFHVSERGRARGLLDRMNGAGIGVVADPEAAERSRRLSAELDALADDIARTTDPAARARRFAEWDARLAAYDVAQERVDASRAPLAADTPRTLDQVRASIPDDDTVVLHYALGRAKSHVWAITRSGARVFTLAPQEELERAATSLRILLTARLETAAGETAAQRSARIAAARANMREATQTASRLLLTPLSSEPSITHYRRVVVVPDGALHQVPFASLVAPGSTAPLVDDHELAVLPSASALSALRREPRVVADGTVAILADPVFGSSDARLGASRSTRAPATRGGPAELDILAEAAGVRAAGGTLPRLGYTRTEALSISKLVASPSALVAMGFQAKRSVLLEPAAARYRIIHLATHALVDSARPELSGLAFSMVDERGTPIDGFLPMQRLYNMRLSADLVVLSACQTAAGKEVGGEGVMSLARGFMAAGVPRVLASLWKVDDQATAELMRVFYEAHLGPARLAPAAALRHAQNWMRRQPRWADPYFWAAWTLHGDPS